MKRTAGAIAPVVFDRRKYGRPFSVDANPLPGLPGFITAPRPHRLQFHELVLLSGGQGFVDLDGSSVELRPGRLIFSVPGEVRCWRLDAVLEGRVVCFERDFLGEFFADAGWLDGLPFFAPGGRRHLDLDAATLERSTRLAGEMHAELRSPGPHAEHLLRALLYRLLVELARAAAASDTPPPVPVLLRRFQALVERQFRSVKQVRDYAGRLGVSTARLNAAVRRVGGAGAGALIRQRLFLEARRLLLYGDDSVAAIAEQLGFSDASYFNRFFRRLAGATPQAFRAAYRPSRGIDRK